MTVGSTEVDLSEPYQGSHEDEFFDWYITATGMMQDGCTDKEAMDYLRVMEAPLWVINRLEAGSRNSAEHGA